MKLFPKNIMKETGKKKNNVRMVSPLAAAYVLCIQLAWTLQFFVYKELDRGVPWATTKGGGQSNRVKSLVTFITEPVQVGSVWFLFFRESGRKRS